MMRRSTASTCRLAVGASSLGVARRYVTPEEQAEIDRETKLRQDFLKKRMHAAQQGSFMERVKAQWELASEQAQAASQNRAKGGFGMGQQATNPFTSGNPFVPAQSYQQQQQQQGGNPSRPTIGSAFYAALVYSTAIYLVWACYEMRKPTSLALSGQGLPRWAAPVETTVTYIALRVLVSQSRQSEIQNGFVEFSKTNPGYNIYQYVQTQHPTAFAGRTVTQSEFLDALYAIGTSERDMGWTRRVLTGGSRWSDDQARIDTAMEKIRAEYPQCVRQQQQQAYGSPQYANQQQQQWGQPQYQQQQQQQWAQQPQYQWGQQQQQQQQQSGNASDNTDNGSTGGAPATA